MRIPRTAREAAWLSLVHWRKMIRWAERQETNETADPYRMRRDISTYWGGKHCALCAWSRAEEDRRHDNRESLIMCPLAKRYGHCGGARNAWGWVNSASTWDEWLKHARRMERQIEAVWRELR